MTTKHEQLEKTFREAYGAKRRVEASREREDKPFSGSAVNNANEKLHLSGHTASTVTYPLKNQMLDSLKGYLDNIAVATTKTVAKGGPLTELSASLAISIDTVTDIEK